MNTLTDDDLVFLKAEEKNANARLMAVYQHYDRKLRNWTLLNAAWTLVLAIASLLWWLR